MASSAIPTPVVSIGWGLSHFNLIKDTTNNALHLLGVLKNETGKDQDLVGVIIGFLDNSGDTTYFDFALDLEIAPKGVSVPFHLELDLIDYVSFELDIDTDLSQDVIVTLSTTDIQVALNNGGYDVTGKVTNPGDDPLTSYADVAVALLDTSGKTIGVGLAQLSALGNGQTAEFTIQIEETEIFGTYADFLIAAVGL